MCSINITNSKKRDSLVGLESMPKQTSVKYLLPDGSLRKNTRLLRATLDMTEEALIQKYNGDLVTLGNAIIDGDPEIDLENTGKIINRTRKIYLDHNSKVVYHINLFQIKRMPDGTEKERHELTKTESNIAKEDAPLVWTGRKISKKQAVQKFVFRLKYQLRHTSGLTYDFLYGIAKELHESGSMMLMGAGSKGAEPLYITTGGEAYRGFLEGRITGDKYCLILHLTDIELKGVEIEIV